MVASNSGLPGESGRVMPIVLSESIRRKLGEAGPRIRVTEIPWELFDEISERTCQRNHSQTLDRIAERGGFDAGEALSVLTGATLQEGCAVGEEQAHRILYAMRSFYRRGVLAGADANGR